MKKAIKTTKLLRRLLLVVVLIVVLFGLGQLLGYFNVGADRSSLLMDTIDFTADAPAFDFNFNDDQINSDDAALLEQISAQYSLALQNLDLAYTSKDSTLLADGFTAGQRAKFAETILLDSKDHHSRTQFIDHHLNFDFLSKDRKIAAFTDKEALRINGFVSTDGDLNIVSEDLVTSRIIMFLEDGFWRIAHWEQLVEKPVEEVSINSDAGFEMITGVNYYPAQFAWDTFNPDLNLETLESDFRTITETGFNAIRIFIDYHSFGGGYLSAEKLNRLNQLLDIADQAKLKVVITLFDFYGDYRLQSWPNTARHLDALVGAIGTHPAIHSWDLKNEPDLDFASRGESRVLSWLGFVGNHMRKLGVFQPLTIGWSNSTSAANLEDLVDYMSFHYYEDPEVFEAGLRTLRSKTTKPLVVQEYGMSTNRGFWAPFGNSKNSQAVLQPNARFLSAGKHFPHELDLV